MVYVPKGHYLWDFWIAPRRSKVDPYHLFYLKAPRSIARPEDRHWVATVGHATSFDLIDWQPEPAGFEVGPAGAWDDKAIWTGSIIDQGDKYWLFYTAISHADGGEEQRIGLATSTNLMTWERHPDNPILTAAPPWYRTHGGPPWEWVSLRDPWVVRDPDRDRWLMYFTAAAEGHPYESAGTIGLAESVDLVTWSLLPPVVDPGDFRQMEVPQIERIGESWYLFFCTDGQAPALRARSTSRTSWWGTHYLLADALTGPFRMTTTTPLVADRRGSWYAGRVVRDPSDGLVFLAWRQWADDGRFLGALSNPASLRVAADGSLSVDKDALWPR
jgi:beta-fructofuranosidase